MPYARGLQYIQVWWENKGIRCVSPGKHSPPLRRAMD
jgi:hypothetical protein